MAVFTISNLASMFAPTYEMLIAARFVAGLPHGAFFGVAAMVASFLMGPKNRAKAVAHVMTGLTVATVVGVPMASWLGQALGWRSAFGLVVAVGVMTLTAIAFWLPPLRSMHVTSPLTELGALKRVQVWLAMLVGMVGFGGMFAVYTYISTTMTDVAGMPRALVPLALMVFGLGMVVGNLVGGKMADVSVVRSLYVTMSALGVALTVFVVASHNPWTALLVLFAIGAAGSAMGPALQIRLMDVAHDAQNAGGLPQPLGAEHGQRDRCSGRWARHRRGVRLHRTRGSRGAALRRGNDRPHRFIDVAEGEPTPSRCRRRSWRAPSSTPPRRRR